MSQLLIKTLRNGSIENFTAASVAATPATLYTIIDSTTGQIPQKLVLARDGDDLVAKISEQEATRITDFYNDNASASFTTDAALSASADIITSSSSPLDTVWSVAENSSIVESAWYTNEFIIGSGLALVAIGASNNDSNSSSGPSGPEPLPENIVIFDMVNGFTSQNSDGTRQFADDVDYKIYLLVQSESMLLADIDSEDLWSGWQNLNAGDEIYLVGDGSPIQGRDNSITGFDIAPSSAYARLWLTSSIGGSMSVRISGTSGYVSFNRRGTESASYQGLGSGTGLNNYREVWSDWGSNPSSQSAFFNSTAAALSAAGLSGALYLTV